MLSTFSCISWLSVSLLWRKVCFGLLSIFWVNFFVFFWYWAVWADCIFWKLIFCQLLHLKPLSPILTWLSFHLGYSAKAFKFNKAPLVYFLFYLCYSRKWVKEDLYVSVLSTFSSKSFIVSGLTFKSLSHFQSIFVHGVRKYSN